MNTQEFKDKILLPSLEIIKHDSKIKKFYFFPGIISVSFLSITLVYQAIYTYIVLLGRKEDALEVLLGLFHSEYIIYILIWGLVAFIIYVLMVPVFEWALIRYIHQKDSWNASRGDSLWFGIYRFAPLFEFNNMVSIFKFVSILNAFLFILRFVGMEYFWTLSVFFLIAFIFSIFIGIFTAYARYEIILWNKWAFEAIGSSARLALLNIKTTLRLYVFMFIMNLKVILNFLVFLGFPLIWVSIAGLISSQIFNVIAFIILWIVFILFIVILGYLNAVLDVFRTTIWYRAYKEWQKNIPKDVE